MNQTVSRFQKCTSILAIIFPLVYSIMYLPFWKGPKPLYQPYNLLFSSVGIICLVVQAICLLYGIWRVYNTFYQKKNGKTFSFALQEFSFAVLIVSALVLMYMSFFFTEVIFGIIPF